MPSETRIQNLPELKLLDDAYSAVRFDAEVLIAALTETQAAYRPVPAAWTVAECLDHLAVTNRGYLVAMQLAADSARRAKKFRRRPALPGFLGGWFVRSLEPPAKLKTKAPQAIRPRTAPTLADASAALLAFTPKRKNSSAPTPTSTSPQSASPILLSASSASPSPPPSI